MEQPSCKITTFPSPTHLSDDDIINLIMGVARMLRNYASEEQILRVLEKLEENGISLI
ncbi:MAG: hypothetical protein FWE45_00670 [Firmicutes bacterium]|nr:hypothetical protein [Bacillota bacterium]